MYIRILLVGWRAELNHCQLHRLNFHIQFHLHLTSAGLLCLQIPHYRTVMIIILKNVSSDLSPDVNQKEPPEKNQAVGGYKQFDMKLRAYSIYSRPSNHGLEAFYVCFRRISYGFVVPSAKPLLTI